MPMFIKARPFHTKNIFVFGSTFLHPNCTFSLNSKHLHMYVQLEKPTCIEVFGFILGVNVPAKKLAIFLKINVIFVQKDNF
jgi:hypothetical protein